MGFEFRATNTIEVCGRQYVVNDSDLGFLEGIYTDFSRLMAMNQDLAGLKDRVFSSVQKQDAEEMDRAAKEVLDRNREIIEAAQGFIIKTIGREGYEAAFAGRMPNAVDHMDLCAYLYQQIAGRREDTLKKYLVPQGGKTNGTANTSRRGGKKPSNRH